MKKCNAPKNQTTRRILLTACATALAVAFTVSLPSQARAGQVTVPPVPADLEVEPGFKAFLEGHAVGTQNYVCQPSGAGFAFVLFTPQATLFNDADHQIITTSSAPTRMSMARFAPRGRTRGTRAPSGPRWFPKAPSPSILIRLPGSSWRWLEPKTDRPVATSFRTPNSSSG